MSGAGHVAKYENQGYVIPKRVWFSCPTNDTILRRGTGLCYNYSYTETGTGRTATDGYGKRGQVVVLPSSSVNRHFAGVTVKDYPMITAGTNQGMWIDIYEPGSVCEVLVGQTTAINTGFLTCSCDAPDVGIFSQVGLPGRGSMTPLQTITITRRDISGVTVVDAAGLNISETGIGTAIGATAETGDYVMYIMSHAITGTGVADATFVRGKFNLSYVGADDVLLTSTTAATGHDNPTTAVDSTTASSVFYYITPKAGQYCLAYLQTGEESGCQQVIELDYGVQTFDMMAGGTSHFHGDGITLAGATEAAVFVVQVGGGLKRVACDGPISTTTGITIGDGAVPANFIMAGSALASITQVGTADDAVAQFTPTGDTMIIIATDMTEA